MKVLAKIGVLLTLGFCLSSAAMDQFVSQPSYQGWRTILDCTFLSKEDYEKFDAQRRGVSDDLKIALGNDLVKVYKDSRQYIRQTLIDQLNEFLSVYKFDNRRIALESLVALQILHGMMLSEKVIYKPIVVEQNYQNVTHSGHGYSIAIEGIISLCREILGNLFKQDFLMQNFIVFYRNMATHKIPLSILLSAELEDYMDEAMQFLGYINLTNLTTKFEEFPADSSIQNVSSRTIDQASSSKKVDEEESKKTPNDSTDPTGTKKSENTTNDPENDPEKDPDDMPPLVD
jgi:hypothetical protein